MGIEVLFGAVYVAAVGMSLWSVGRLKGFLASTGSISDRACLERFKELARLQMYLALAMIALLGMGFVAGIVIMSRYGLSGLALVLAANAAVVAPALYHKKIENRVRSLPAASEALAEEHRRVSESWVKKALPDF